MKKTPKKPDREEVLDAFHALPEEAQNALQELLRQAKDDPKEFVRLAMVGDCPFCGGSNTRDCDETSLGDITVGICLDCYRLWCLECGFLFSKGQTLCDHWVICQDCKFNDINYEEGETCGTTADECSIIKEKLLGASK
jgi:hypothetical protein